MDDLHVMETGIQLLWVWWKEIKQKPGKQIGPPRPNFHFEISKGKSSVYWELPVKLMT